MMRDASAAARCMVDAINNSVVHAQMDTSYKQDLNHLRFCGTVNAHCLGRSQCSYDTLFVFSRHHGSPRGIHVRIPSVGHPVYGELTDGERHTSLYLQRMLEAHILVPPSPSCIFQRFLALACGFLPLTPLKLLCALVDLAKDKTETRVNSSPAIDAASDMASACPPRS